jgi:glycosyltransferase involved in cell wall biosynthesis
MVLHLIDSAGMYGAERVILTLLEEVKNSPHYGILGCIRENDTEVPSVAKEAQRIGIQVVYFTMRRGFNPFGIYRISKFIKEKNIRIVHSHGYKPNIYLAFIYKKKFITISTVHGWAKKTGGLMSRLYEFLDVQVLKRMDLLVAVSEDISKDLIRHGVKKEKIQIIHNGLKLSKLKHHHNADQIHGNISRSFGIPILGALGRLVRVKGYENIIKAMPIIQSSYGPCKLVIGGDGPLKGELEKLVVDLHLEQDVTLAGFVNNVNAFFSMIDIFVMPSISEGLPIALLEAMAFKKPVVASSVGGIRELIRSQEHGVLIKPGDPVAIARAVTMLLHQPGKMKSMATLVFKVVRSKFSAEVMATNYLKLYSRFTYES